MQKLLKYIILFGIFTLPLINSRITSLLGFSFSMPVSGNYEFTKVMFFNIWSSLVILLFFLNYVLSSFSIKGSTRRGMDYKWLIPFYLILLISTIFSESPIVSFLGNSGKSHSFLMWSNLVGLFIVFSLLFSSSFSIKGLGAPGGGSTGGMKGMDYISFPQLIKTFIFSGVFVSIIGLKEYFFPTFNYGDLGNRLFSTFGHPNYLSIFLVGLMPFLYGPHLTSPYRRGIIGLFIITLIFTKSFIAIFLFLIFNLYYFYNNLSSFRIKGSTFLGSMSKKGMDYKFFSLFLIILLGFSLIYLFIPEKLHSFVSRFFIWETTIRIIFSDIKLFLIGGGTDTLTLFFNNFKSEYMYIFENLGFTADRPHNIILNFFYHFGVGGLIFISFIYYKVFSFKKLPLLEERAGVRSLILIFIFLLFNPTNIVIYLLITILLANLNLFQNNKININGTSFKIFFTYITIISIFGAYFSFKHYISEIYFYKNNYTKALREYKFNPELYFIKSEFNKGLKISKTKNQLYYKYKIRAEKNNINLIKEFLGRYNYAENYFYIGNIFWNNGKKEIAKNFYKKGLEKLPDLWNKDSKYYQKFLVKNLKVDDHRLTSKKYGLAKILERVKKN